MVTSYGAAALASRAMQDDPTAALAAASAMFSLIFGIFYLAVIVVGVASLWRLFTKAGQPGWAAIVPVYNIIILTQIARKPTWWVVMFFIPCANIVFAIMLWMAVAEAFGKSAGWGVGVVLLPIPFLPILAFSSSTQYVGGAAGPGGYGQPGGLNPYGGPQPGPYGGAAPGGYGPPGGGYGGPPGGGYSGPPGGGAPPGGGYGPPGGGGGYGPPGGGGGGGYGPPGGGGGYPPPGGGGGYGPPGGGGGYPPPGGGGGGYPPPGGGGGGYGPPGGGGGYPPPGGGGGYPPR